MGEFEEGDAHTAAVLVSGMAEVKSERVKPSCGSEFVC